MYVRSSRRKLNAAKSEKDKSGRRIFWFWQGKQQRLRGSVLMYVRSSRRKLNATKSEKDKSGQNIVLLRGVSLYELFRKTAG